MCFSATASFSSGVVVGVIGVATLSKVRHPRELLLGSLPLLFGLHQIEEGMVWLWLEGRLVPQAGHWFMWLYVLFAEALLPTLSPLSFWLAEPSKDHRRLLLPVAAVGVLVTVCALATLAGGPLLAEIRHHGVEYKTPLIGPWPFAVLYILTTCSPPFLSSYPWMIVFGGLNLMALLLAALVKAMAFTSAWCAFAAVLSALVYLHFVRVRDREAAQAVS
jgi:uncharacterized protein DUF6629